MIRKTKCLVFFLIILCIFSSCSKTESPKRGTVKDGYFENTAFNVSYNAPEEWSFLDDREMALAMGLATSDATDDEIAGLLETSATIYDMYCISEDSVTTINVCYELNTANEEQIYDLDSYLELSKSSIESMIEYYGSMELIKAETSEITIGGKENKCLNVQIYLTESDKVYYEMVIVKEVNGWIATATIGSGAETEESAMEDINGVIDNLKF